MKYIICFMSLFCISCAVYGQSENGINSMIEESLVNYFNHMDSLRVKHDMPLKTERYVCSVGLPLGYDDSNDQFTYHDESYATIKKYRKKGQKGIGSAYVFLDFQNEYFVVSVSSRNISYRNRKNCKIIVSDSMQFKYKFNPQTNTWECVSHEAIAL